MNNKRTEDAELTKIIECWLSEGNVPEIIKTKKRRPSQRMKCRTRKLSNKGHRKKGCLK